jgi:hypothetical protein
MRCIYFSQNKSFKDKVHYVKNKMVGDNGKDVTPL